MKLWDHDKIVYCLKSICIDLYMYKVSYAPMLLYLSASFAVPFVCGTDMQSTNSTENKSRALLLYPYILYEIKGKLQTSHILL